MSARVYRRLSGRVRQLLTKVRPHLASGHPGQNLWRVLSPANLERAHDQFSLD